jgi:chromosome segregation ATPase
MQLQREVEEAQREVKAAQQALKNYEQSTKQVDLAKRQLEHEIDRYRKKRNSIFHMDALKTILMPSYVLLIRLDSCMNRNPKYSTQMP